jgi:predicted dehydrogenase
MLRVGIVGFGFMGRMHYRCWRELADVDVVAICDPDPHAMDDAGKNRGNIAGAEGAVDLNRTKIHTDLARMLADEQLDAVSITVPTHLHATYTLEALKAGVHVLCEKPMARHLAEGLHMIEAAEDRGKILQIGHCIRFWPEYAKAKEMIDSGQHGRVLAATFQRLAATAWRKVGSWFADEELSGGMPLDLHIHDTDFIQYLFGMPRSVCSSGASDATGGLAHLVTSYAYDDGKLVTAEGGWAMVPAYGLDMRFHVVLERATIAYDLRHTPALRLFTAEGETLVPDCGKGDGYSRQIAHFAQQVRGESVAPVITPQQAWNSLRIVEAERESARSGGKVAIG